MSDTQIPEGIPAVVAEHNAIHVTNTIVNQSITINEAERRAVAHSATHHPVQHHSGRAVQHPRVAHGAAAGQIPANPAPKASGPVVTFNDYGDQVISYADTRGGKATIVRAQGDKHTITFTAQDASGTVQSFGDHRNYQSVGRTGGNAQATSHHAWYDPRGWFNFINSAQDTLTCPQSSLAITPAQNELMTIEKLQGFADHHPELAGILAKRHDLNVATLNGQPIDFATAVHTPTVIAACPEHHH